jgi:hypothetical protein
MIKNFQDQTLNGLAHDLMFAKRYFHLFKQIKKKWNKLSLLKHIDKEWVLLLKDSSIQQTILYLSKIYDSSGVQKNKSTRCLRDLLKELDDKLVNESYKVIAIMPGYWTQFCDKHKEALDSLGFSNTENFIYTVQSFLDAQFSKDKTVKNELLINLKSIRNKEVAHNENYKTEETFSHNDAEELIYIADAILDYLNIFITTGVITQYADQDYMIEQQIEKIFTNVL